MKSIEKKADFNAHISDIHVTLLRENEKNYAQIACRNVSGKTIAQISFKARGFDYFDDVIKNGDEEYFTIMTGNLELLPGACSEECRTKINEEIRRLEVQEAVVWFADGTKADYPGPDYHIYYAECFMEDSYRDKPEFDVLKEMDGRFCCYPKENGEGWLCACAYLNRKDRMICGGCGHGKTEIFSNCSREAVAEKIREKDAAFEEKMRQMAALRKKKDRIATVKFLLEMVLTIALLFFAGWMLLHAYRA